jgi:hypothetical protein
MVRLANTLGYSTFEPLSSSLHHRFGKHAEVDEAKKEIIEGNAIQRVLR